MMLPLNNGLVEDLPNGTYRVYGNLETDAHLENLVNRDQLKLEAFENLQEHRPTLIASVRYETGEHVYHGILYGGYNAPPIESDHESIDLEGMALLAGEIFLFDHENRVCIVKETDNEFLPLCLANMAGYLETDAEHNLVHELISIEDEVLQEHEGYEILRSFETRNLPTAEVIIN